MPPIFLLVFGLACAVLGSAFFVRGAAGLARWAKLPAGIVGTTVAALATSGPELSVSVSSAVAGTPQIGLGDVLTSNVVNVGLILGLALFFGPLKGGEGSIGRDLPVALAAPILTAVLLFDGALSRLDGAILIVVFLCWLGLTVNDARRERAPAPEPRNRLTHGQAATLTLAGLGLLVLAGVLVVDGAKDVGARLGWSPFVTGALLVSVGTSVPEFAITIASRLRDQDDVGLGTILGSNVFNGLFVVGVAATIHPIEIAFRESLVGLGFGVLVVAATIPRRGRTIGRRRGRALLTISGIYLAALLWKPWQEQHVSAKILTLVGAPLAALFVVEILLLRAMPDESRRSNSDDALR